MYRHLGGRFVLLVSGASGAADVTVGANQPRVVDMALKILAVPMLVELTVALGLLSVVIALRVRPATRRPVMAGRRSWSVPLAASIRPIR